MSASVRTGLLSCFTGFLEPYRKSAVENMQQDSLREAQLKMAGAGAPKMVARMLQDPNQEVFAAALAFATSLFWGGNPAVQDALLRCLESDTTHSLLRVLSEKVSSGLIVDPLPMVHPMPSPRAVSAPPSPTVRMTRRYMNLLGQRPHPPPLGQVLPKVRGQAQGSGASGGPAGRLRMATDPGCVPTLLTHVGIP